MGATGQVMTLLVTFFFVAIAGVESALLWRPGYDPLGPDLFPAIVAGLCAVLLVAVIIDFFRKKRQAGGAVENEKAASAFSARPIALWALSVAFCFCLTFDVGSFRLLAPVYLILAHVALNGLRRSPLAWAKCLGGCIVLALVLNFVFGTFLSVNLP